MPTTMVTNLLSDLIPDLDQLTFPVRKSVERLQPLDDQEAQRLIADVQQLQAALNEPALRRVVLRSAHALERLPTGLHPLLLLAQVPAHSDEADAYGAGATLWIAFTLGGQFFHFTTASDDGLAPSRVVALERDGTDFALRGLADEALLPLRLALAARLTRDLRLGVG